MRKKITLALLSLLLVPLGMMAQNVTVHAGNGNMLPALKSGESDTFFSWGGFATWKHNQLSLTLTTGDSDNNPSGASATGQLGKPANDIFKSADGCLQIGKGRSSSEGGVSQGLDTYITIALPKGYRFTGYSMEFHRLNKPNTTTSDAIKNWDGAITFGETTDGTFNNYVAGKSASIAYKSNASNYSSETIERTSKTEMGNVLYFKLSNGREYTTNTGRAFIQIDKLELQFTAESDYVPLTQNITAATNVSAIKIPFTTSKMDYGQLVYRNEDGREPYYNYEIRNPERWGFRICYDGNIHDMNANLDLYEDGSVRQISAAQNTFDGTAGFEVEQRSGSISTAGDFLKLESTKHGQFADSETDEVFYYIETPTWAVNSSVANANKNPIGYRITGVKFNYGAGSGTTYLPATFYIEYESKDHGFPQDGIYGVNWYGGNLSYNYNYKTVWRIDQQGYIYHGSDYLAVSGTNIIVVNSKANASQFEVVNNQIRQINTENYIGWKETVETYIGDDGEEHIVYDTYEDEDGIIIQTEVPKYIRTVVVAEDEAHRSTYNQQQAATTIENGEYYLKIYGPDGTTVKQTIHVTGAGGSSQYWTGYNNDAVKIGVIGTALINGELTLQALDPYIDRLRIVCQQEDGNGGTVSQQFNATDFSVKGGAFTFYVPMSFDGNAKFTFEDLYSKYGDETYYNETSSTNHARYFFVGSTYGDSYANVYDRYKNNSSADYTTKIACLKPGNKAYTFNNAATAATTNGSYFEEYPFSKALYASKVSGSFTDFIFPSGSMNGNTTKTAYLFTCDETRYNIAPTTATQHVYYAFYQMDIKMNKKDYTPKSIWTQVYDHTCYNNGTSTAVIDKPQYGLKLGTTVASEEGDPNGYLTVSQVKNAITTITGIVQNLGKTVTDANSKFDIDKDNDIDKDDLKKASNVDEDVDAPESTEQILYIDGSELLSLVEDKQNNVEMTLDKLREGLGANALVYLPKGTTSEYSNIAYMTQTGSFWGADDFELIDMRPFYAPYDIQIDPEKTITYKRSITVPKNGKVTSASIIMPFEIDLTNAPFTLHKMQATNCLNGTADEVYFPVVSGDTKVTKAEANTPYMLKVTNPGSEDKYSFVLTQGGTLIKATTGMVMDGDLKYTFTGETGNGAKDGKAIEFVNHGTYAGLQLPYDGYYFYFSKNMFLRSNDYTYKGTIKMAPFRIFYSATGEGRAKLAAFDIIFDEGMGDTPDGINSLTRRADLMVTAGKGTITMASTIDQDVRVNSLNGMLINNVSLQSGEMHTINVPTGIYVVNGVKIIVK